MFYLSGQVILKNERAWVRVLGSAKFVQIYTYKKTLFELSL